MQDINNKTKKLEASSGVNGQLRDTSMMPKKRKKKKHSKKYVKRQVHFILRISAALLAALFLIPLGVITILRYFKEPSRELSKAASVAEEQKAEEIKAPEVIPFSSGQQDAEIMIKVLHKKEGRVEEIDIGKYLLCVLRGEMPASFEEEALKAQAVAARTYTMNKILKGSNHGSTADICTDPGCCQAYKDEETARSGWGELADTYEQKIEAAVKETDGQYILYEGKPILAVFHSSSAPMTREAGKVWVDDVPYLQAVSSPEKGENIPNYYSRVEMTLGDFRARVYKAFPEANLSGESSGWITDVVRDAGGNVETISVGGVSMRGVKLRSILGLRSACFQWEIERNEDGEKIFAFYVTGYGHGVGLSQYGANQMAKDGAEYSEILTHYYTGVTIGHYPEELTA